jgi:YqzL-like protein
MSIGEMVHMRNFSWNYFWATGDLDAYMLYKEVTSSDPNQIDDQDDDGFDLESETMSF